MIPSAKKFIIDDFFVYFIITVQCEYQHFSSDHYLFGGGICQIYLEETEKMING
jgi:hypothetical protein